MNMKNGHLWVGFVLEVDFIVQQWFVLIFSFA